MLPFIAAKNDKSLQKAMEMLHFTRGDGQGTHSPRVPAPGVRDSSGPGLGGGLPGEPECVFSAVAFGCKDAFIVWF